MAGSLTLKWRALAWIGGLVEAPTERLGAAAARVAMRRSSRGTPSVLGRPPPLAEVIDETIGDVPVRRYLPPTPKPGVIVYFHGGGWVLGDLDTHDIPCRVLAARTNRTVVAVHYRLAPEHRFPAALDDCLAVTKALAGSDRVLVAGDSAGGHLAAVVTRRCQSEGVGLAGQALIYPVTDCSKESDSYRRYATGFFLHASTMRFFIDAFLPDRSTRTHPDASPLLAPPEKLPPAYVLLAECDVLRDEGHAYAKQLAAGGTEVSLDEVPGVFHGFFSLQGISESRAATDRLVAFIDRSLAEP